MDNYYGYLRTFSQELGARIVESIRRCKGQTILFLQHLKRSCGTASSSGSDHLWCCQTSEDGAIDDHRWRSEPVRRSRLAVIDPQRGGTALVNNSLPFLEMARNLDLGVPKMTAYPYGFRR